MSSKNHLFVVLRPQGKVRKLAEALQEEINNRYHIYPESKLPMLHISLAEIVPDQVNNKFRNKLISSLKKVADKSKPIDLLLRGFHCFSSSSKPLTLELDKTESLRILTKNVHDAIKNVDNNLEILNEAKDIKFHITLTSSFFARRPMNDQIYERICTLLESKSLKVESKTNIMELWSPYLEPEKAILKRFCLKGN